MMKIIVGLGNPGKEYEKTRHNAGFLVLEELKARMINDPFDTAQDKQSSIINQDLSFEFQMNKRLGAEVVKVGEVMLVKPQGFMNRSGEVVKKIVDFFKIPVTSNQTPENSSLWVVHDDLDIKLGEYKIQFGRGPKVHNGVNSIREALGTDQFWYVRVGIDNRATSDRLQATGEEYVLRPFMEDERDIIERVVEAVAEEIHGRIV
jgi:PTH1 family peptidyl-tRNA hydrolase